MESSQISYRIARYAAAWVAVLFVGCELGSNGGVATTRQTRAPEAVETVRSGIHVAGQKPMSLDLLLHWAPIVHQRVRNHAGMDGVPDHWTTVQYDGNYIGTDNWDNATSQPFRNLHKAVAYGATVETTSHFFLFYGFYHARDWLTGASVRDSQHEHDMEGAIFVVRKDGTPFGSFEAALTVAHGDFWPHRSPTAPHIGRGPSAIKADRGMRTIHMEQLLGESHHRPMLWQEAEGHGVYGCTDDRPCPASSSLSRIRYIPTLNVAEIPPAPLASGELRSVRYRIAEMNASDGALGLSDLRTCSSMFDARWFRGDSSGSCSAWPIACSGAGAAAPIWAQNDPNDRITADWGVDPARTIDDWFTFGPSSAPSSDYINNPLLAGASNLCEMGPPIAPTTFCSTQICIADPSCCTSGWSSNCVAQVSSVCGGLSCTGGGGTCQHSPCQVGTALNTGCSHCVAQICEADSFCCNDTWDQQCVDQVASVCDLHCSVPSTCQ